MKTAEELRAEARAHSEASRESFERCDTDGFLSQWANDVQARKLLTEAQLVEQGGVDRFTTLADQDGNLVPVKKINTRYGLAYAVFSSFEALAEYDAEIIQWVNINKKAIAKKGYKRIVVEAEAKVVLGKGWNPSAFIVPKAPYFTPENCTVIGDYIEEE